MVLPLETSDLLFVGGILLVTITMVRRIRRRSQHGAPASNATAVQRPAPPSVPASDLSQARLYETFRELNARLETKIHVLNALIEEANEAIERLQTLQAATKQNESDRVQRVSPVS